MNTNSNLPGPCNFRSALDLYDNLLPRAPSEYVQFNNLGVEYLKGIAHFL